MSVTLEEIQTAQDKLAGMIAAFTQQPRFPLTVPVPEPRDGEVYVGTIITADGSRREHVFKLPGEIEEVTWQEATDWAVKQGGELFDRVEGALLFATMKDDFKPEWYWTRELHASDARYAWGQYFSNGYQVNDEVSSRGRAVAVRKLIF